jgi:hypothetical protein
MLHKERLQWRVEDAIRSYRWPLLRKSRPLSLPWSLTIVAPGLLHGTAEHDLRMIDRIASLVRSAKGPGSLLALCTSPCRSAGPGLQVGGRLSRVFWERQMAMGGQERSR